MRWESMPRVVISLDKRLPVQGGLGGASANAVAVLLGLERALHCILTPAQRLQIAASVGSDLPLFLMGGTVLGVSRGEEVYPVADLPESHLRGGDARHWGFYARLRFAIGMKRIRPRGKGTSAAAALTARPILR